MLKSDRLKSLLKCHKGGVAIVFALMLIPLFLIIGAAVDYSRTSQTRSLLQEYLDASTLAGAAAKDDDEARIQRAFSQFQGSIASASDNSGAPIKVDGPGRLIKKSKSYVIQDLKFEIVDEPGKGKSVRGAITGYVPSMTSSLTGYGALPLNLESKALISDEGRQLDMVFCIDSTGSMGGTIDWVKDEAGNLSNRINSELMARNLPGFEAMRARVIFYRDFNADKGAVDRPGTKDYTTPQAPIYRSKGQSFYVLKSPESDSGESGSLRNFLATEVANGGGDAPESGFICLNEALRATQWAKKGDLVAGSSTKRITQAVPMVVLWTDADARPLSDAVFGSVLQPPSSHAGLKAVWNNQSVIDQENKILVFFGNATLGATGLIRAPIEDDPSPCGPSGCGGGDPGPGGPTPGDPGTPAEPVPPSPPPPTYCTVDPETEACPPVSGGYPEWEATIANWGVDEYVFPYPLQPGSTSLPKKLVDALEQRRVLPRLVK